MTTAIQGVTLNLTAAAIGTPAGTPQTLTVAQDTSSASTAINNFVSLYNTLVTTYGQVGNDNSAGSEYARRRVGLQPDACHHPEHAGGHCRQRREERQFDNLAGSDRHHATGTSHRDAAAGSLVIDSTKLAAALQSNPSGVAALFNSTTGVAAQMTTSLNSFLSAGRLDCEQPECGEHRPEEHRDAANHPGRLHGAAHEPVSGAVHGAQYADGDDEQQLAVPDAIVRRRQQRGCAGIGGNNG